MEQLLVAEEITLKDHKEYYYKVSIDPRRVYKFRLFQKIKHDTDKILISMGNSDFYEFKNDIVYVISSLLRYGLKCRELDMYRV